MEGERGGEVWEEGRRRWKVTTEEVEGDSHESWRCLAVPRRGRGRVRVCLCLPMTSKQTLKRGREGGRRGEVGERDVEGGTCGRRGGGDGR